MFARLIGRFREGEPDALTQPFAHIYLRAISGGGYSGDSHCEESRESIHGKCLAPRFVSDRKNVFALGALLIHHFFL